MTMQQPGMQQVGAPVGGLQSTRGYAAPAAPPPAPSSGGPLSSRPSLPSSSTGFTAGALAAPRPPLASPPMVAPSIAGGLSTRPALPPMMQPPTAPPVARLPPTSLGGMASTGLPTLRPGAPAIAPGMLGPQQSQQPIEQQALGGNAQQVQNFMRALNGVGAGSNNSFASSAAPSPASGAPLLGAPTALGGNAGTVGYNDTFGNGGADSTTAPPWRTTQPFDPNNGAGANAGAWFASHNPGGSGGLVSTGGAVAAQPFDPNNGAGSLLRGLMQGGASSSSDYNIGVGNGVPSAPATTAAPPLAVRPSLPPSVSGFAGLMSDARAKDAVEPAGDKVRSFLNAIQAHEYEYKDPQDGEGRFVSPMAQELASTELGRSAVVETPRGLMVHYGRLGGVNLAAAADLHRRLSALERGE